MDSSVSININSILNKLLLYKIPQSQLSKLARFGVDNDGGYVILKPDSISSSQSLIWDLYISAGIGNEESFSKNFITYYGLQKNQCWAFDGTIASYPRQYKPCPPQGIWFVSKNIGPQMTDMTVNLGRLISQYNNIFLKMDIEGAEYDWLLSLSVKQLTNFKEIVIEFHNINTDCRVANVWKLLNSTHMAIHIHPNNFGGTINNIPNVVEITYIRRNDCAFITNTDNIIETEHDITDPATDKWTIYPKGTPIYPIKNIDFPNNPRTPDLYLTL